MTNKIWRPGRRTALLMPLALGGCDWIDNLMNPKKDPLPGKRESIGAVHRGFEVDPTPPAIALPPPTPDNAWAQAGGNPVHVMGHLSLKDTPAQAWRVDLGEGGGSRRKILCQPVVSNGVVYAQDSNAVVSAFRLDTGARMWRTATVDEDARSSNVGGGLSLDGATLFAVNGMAELLALDPGTGAIRWRHGTDVPAQSAATVADGRVFIATVNNKLQALSADDGHSLWSYQATPASTTILGGPAPAVSQGIVIAGFASGEIAALRAETGAEIWTDGLGISEGGRASSVEFLAIRGAPVVSNGQVYLTGLGGLTVAADVLTGRRVWERRIASNNTPWIASSWLFIISTDQAIGAINVDAARVAWVHDLPRFENPDKQKDPITWYGPVLAGNRLIVLGTNKECRLLNPLNGETVTTLSLSDNPSPFAPVVADGTLLVVTEDGKLTAWR
jgi:outer membrane protein assembly factor BamB